MQCALVCVEGSEGSDRVARQHAAAAVCVATPGGAGQEVEELVALCESPGESLVLLQLLVRGPVGSWRSSTSFPSIALKQFLVSWFWGTGN